MNTPIYDFVSKYIVSDVARLHMPGHKGKRFIGCEERDITEIHGADVLYGAEGIIAQSEDNASALFGTAHTFYSAEGSSLAVKAMLALAAYDVKNTVNAALSRQKPLVIAARNVHKSFVYACALLDLDVEFIFSEEKCHLCSCSVSPNTVKMAIENAIRNTGRRPCAVYITSPDYLGNIADIRGIADVCHSFGLPLLTDNAHGAYLAFLKESMHPIALGADMCCDSAHKTLPALTGAAYLHISENAPAGATENARARLSLFASTSPSYLILQSLDLCNQYLCNGYTEKLEKCAEQISALKQRLRKSGYSTEGSEPLKLTLRISRTKDADDASELLRKNGIECEYSDGEYLVFMITPENSGSELERLENALLSLPLNCRNAENTPLPMFFPERVCSVRAAIFAPHETVSAENAIGRICASPTVACPPAVPIAVSGERITEQAAEAFRKYGISTIDVVK